MSQLGLLLKPGNASRTSVGVSHLLKLYLNELYMSLALIC